MANDKIKDFDLYKADFLAKNKQQRGMILLRRTRDNVLTWAPEDSADHYEGHVIEPLPDFEEPTGQGGAGDDGGDGGAAKAKGEKRVAKSATTQKPEPTPAAPLTGETGTGETGTGETGTGESGIGEV